MTSYGSPSFNVYGWQDDNAVNKSLLYRGVANSNTTTHTFNTDGYQSCTLDGQTAIHGEDANFYSASQMVECSSDIIARTCENGTFGGDTNYAIATCTNYDSCTLAGITVAHGQSATFYNDTGNADCSTIAQSRTCYDGTLDGSSVYQFASCTTKVYE